MFAVVFPSLLDPTEKEKDVVNGGWRIESAASAAARLDEKAETIALVKETVVDDSGCAWMALNTPSVALDRKSTRLNSSHSGESRMPSSA